MGKIGSLVVGAVAGFVAGVLLTPKSGKETRDEIKRKAQSVTDASKEGLSRAGEEIKEGGRRLKTIADDSVESLKESAKEAQAELEHRGEALKDEAVRTRRNVNNAR